MGTKRHDERERREMFRGVIIKSPVVFLFIVVLVLGGCAKRIYDVAYPTLSDGRYDTEFPYKNCSKQLSDISNSVKKLNYIVYYRSYVFLESDGLTRPMLKEQTMKDMAIKEILYTQTGYGTATTIYHENRRVAFLTCAHIVDTPDTMVSYFSGQAGKDKIVQSITIKRRQQNFIVDMVGGGELDIIKTDVKKDIAVVGRKDVPQSEFVKVLAYPAGRSNELEWGSFVYLLGYPIGYKMITRGIVSNPNMDVTGSFLVDALFNRGFSGGIVLAIKDGVPNFELVGMTKSVSAESSYVLTPSHDMNSSSYDPYVPYDGSVYVQLKKEINYGITHAVSIETIRQFFKENEDAFIAQGYDFSHIFY